MQSFWILTLAIMAGQLIRLPLGTGGVNLLDIAVIILCLFGLFQLKLHLKKPPPFIKAAFVFIFITLLSLVLTPLQLKAPEYLASFFYIVRFSFYIFLGWLILSGALPHLRKNIDQILLFSGVGLALLGLVQFIFLPNLGFLSNYGWDPHYFRTASTFLDPNFLGSFLSLTLFVILQDKTLVKKWRTKTLFVIVYLVLLTTFSRGAYLAFLTGSLSIAFLKRSVKFAIITSLLFIGLLIGFFTYQRLVAAPLGVDRAQSAEFRFNTWQQGWQLFQSYPLLGVGFNAYKFALREYNLADEKFLKSHGSSTNDASLLYVAATTGILGLISYLIFLGSLIWTGHRTNYVLVAGCAGLIAQSFFANTLFYPPLLIWIILTSQKK